LSQRKRAALRIDFSQRKLSRRKRVTLKLERTPEELAELRAERARFSRERPGPEDLVASGEYEGPYRQGNIMALLSAVAELKRHREEQGLSLADVSGRSGLDRALLSRLENGKVLNPTLTTLWRYADAIGAQVSLAVELLPTAADS
jgi:DNA-binding XRE family transcriptional regulator